MSVPSETLSGMTIDTELLAWLLDTDPALRWQVERDLAKERDVVWAATRTRWRSAGASGCRASGR